jgi:Kef-type K+ transport system membrane component KefB
LGDGRLTPGIIAVALGALLLSALATEAIGVHALFGAFLLGAVIPHDSALARVLTHKLEDLVTVLLLPAFFAFTGMRTQIGLVVGVEEWLLCGLIILVATAGKFGGTYLSARLTRLDWRNAAALGVLMNTRGLMELIVLNIGLDLKVISPTLFAMMVMMALVTTMATTPILQLLVRDSTTEAEGLASALARSSRLNGLFPVLLTFHQPSQAVGQFFLGGSGPDVAFWRFETALAGECGCRSRTERHRAQQMRFET